MAMVCPQCKGSFARQLRCPTCGVSLEPPAGGRPGAEAGWRLWANTGLGRLVVGLAVAQGLGYGLRWLATAGLLAAGDEGKSTVWTTLFGLVLLHGFQGLSLVAGGAVAGAGQNRGILNGALIGLLNGAIFLFSQPESATQLPTLVIYGQPLLHMACGALGGLIGRAIWQPPTSVVLAQAPGAVAKASDRSRPRPPLLAGPIAWVRVVAGCTLVVAGVLCSHSILNFVVEASHKKLTVRSHLQAQLIGWEIAAMAALLGAGLAGATTYNGLKQGLCVGLGAGAVLVGLHLGNPQTVLESTLLMAFSILGVSVVGGWFGGQLFPPVAVRRRKPLSDF